MHICRTKTAVYTVYSMTQSSSNNNIKMLMNAYNNNMIIITQRGICSAFSVSTLMPYL